MGKYSAIADVGSYLIRLLRDNMCPEPVTKMDQIMLCSPADKGDAALGLFLYDVQDNMDLRSNQRISVGKDLLSSPPMVVTLYFLLTVYSNADLKVRYVEEMRILGKAMQVLYDNSVIDPSNLGQSFYENETKIQITQINMQFQDKLRIWSFPNVQYRLSRVYSVSPIAIESTRRIQTRRVVSSEIDIVEGRNPTE